MAADHCVEPTALRCALGGSSRLPFVGRCGPGERGAGNRAQMAEYLAEARRAAERVTDAEAQKMLLDDLGTIAHTDV